MDSDNNTWEHPYTMNDKTEPTQSFEAFKVWVEMGNKRSLKAVAERMEKSHDTIKKYSCTWKWSERLQDKLTHENKIIYGQQLEMVLTSLEMDMKRDALIQHVLNNIAGALFELSLNDFKNFMATQNFKKNNLKPNSKMDLFQRLTNLYSNLEQIHTKNQTRCIDLNKKCLSVQSFQDSKDYYKLIENGKLEQKKFFDGVVKTKQKFNKQDFNPTGISILDSKHYETYKQDENMELTEQEKTPLEEQSKKEKKRRKYTKKKKRKLPRKRK